MSTERERHASLPSTSPEDDALFLDIMHEAPLFGHRKSCSLVGSVFYLILLAGYASFAVASPWMFKAIQSYIPQLLCSCNVLLLILTDKPVKKRLGLNREEDHARKDAWFPRGNSVAEDCVGVGTRGLNRRIDQKGCLFSQKRC